MVVLSSVFLCHVVDEAKVADRIQLVRVEGGFRFRCLSRTLLFFLQHLHSGVVLDSNTN